MQTVASPRPELWNQVWPLPLRVSGYLPAKLCGLALSAEEAGDAESGLGRAEE